MILDKSIFRDYDIRGVYPKQINEDISEVIGKAFGTYLSSHGGNRVVVGRDNRPSSLFLTESFVKGLLSTGMDVTYLGIAITPVVHFLTCGTEFDAGVVVTASHNPREFNGYRFDLQGAIPFYGDEMKKLLKIIESKKFASGEGDYRERDLTQSYIDYIVSKFSFNRKLKVVVDCGNGASSDLAPELFGKMNLDVQPMYCNFDSDFPHDVPDPESPLFLKALEQHVLDAQADIGVGFDTDGDRFGVVDDKGKSYGTDEILMLFAQDVLSKHPGKKVIYDVKSSGALDSFIRNHHGIPEMVRTGHPYYAGRTDNVILGAEFSGHAFFYDDYYGFDDGIYAACRVIDIVANSKSKLSDLMKSIPQRESSPEYKVPCPDDEKFEIVRKINNKVASSHEYSGIIDIDGVRASISTTGWFLIRASNTNPYLSIRMEGSSDRELKVLTDHVSALLAEFDLKLL